MIQHDGFLNGTSCLFVYPQVFRALLTMRISRRVSSMLSDTETQPLAFGGLW